jgi:hypothetical protein
MSLCTCECRPRCQYHYCSRFADWSVFTPPIRKIFGPHGNLKFMCTPCKEYYAEAIAKPLKGIDRPPDAPEDWRPSLDEHLRWARIEMEFEEQKKQPPPTQPHYLDHYWRWYEDNRGFTPAMRANAARLRELRRKYGTLQHSGDQQR